MRGFNDSVAPHHIAFEAYGVPLQACSTSPEIIDRLEPLLPPLRKRIESSPDARRFGIVEEEDGTHSVYNATTQVSTQSPLELALVMLENQMRSWVAMNAPGLVFVHAGVVGHEGRALVLPGDSFAGKTTLVAALVRKGAQYFSDEFAVIDHDGRVHPYPKMLSIRTEDGLQETDHSVESIGGVAGDDALPIGLVVNTFFVPGAQWQPRQLSPGEAALSLLAKTVAARTRPQESLKVLTTALDGVTVLDSERGDADEFADLLLSGAVLA
jgi:hypothetical protein